MPPDDFEELGHRVVRAAYPDARHTGNPDSGADTLLPRFGDRGWDRAWQARRYRRAISWTKCEEALDKAVETYRISHYTFVFAGNLTNTQTTTFDRRLKSRHPGVAVDYWDLSELLARLDETPGGRRAARYFFGPSRDEQDQAWREAVALSGELNTGDDVLGRLRKLGSWLERRDDVFAYETRTWEVGQPQPATTDGTVMSKLEIDERVGSRVDARVRDPGAGEPPMPTVRVDFTPDEAGRRAFEALARSEKDNTPARLTEGFTVTFERLPDLWLDEVGVAQIPSELRLDPVLPDIPPIRAVLKAHCDRNPEVLEFEMHRVLLEGWRTAWRGHFGGLHVTFAVRPTPEGGGQGHLQFRYELRHGASAREELGAVRMVRALERSAAVSISRREHPEAAVTFDLPSQEEHEGIRALAAILESLILIEDFTTERIALPATIASDEAGLIVGIAQRIGSGAWPGLLVGDVVVPATETMVAALRQRGVSFRIHEELGVDLFGRRLWLGVLEYELRSFRVVRKGAPDGHVLLRPRTESARRVTGRLLRGNLRSLPVPDGWTASPAELRHQTGG